MACRLQLRAAWRVVFRQEFGQGRSPHGIARRTEVLPGQSQTSRKKKEDLYLLQKAAGRGGENSQVGPTRTHR